MSYLDAARNKARGLSVDTTGVQPRQIAGSAGNWLSRFIAETKEGDTQLGALGYGIAGGLKSTHAANMGAELQKQGIEVTLDPSVGYSQWADQFPGIHESNARLEQASEDYYEGGGTKAGELLAQFTAPTYLDVIPFAKMGGLMASAGKAIGAFGGKAGGALSAGLFPALAKPSKMAGRPGAGAGETFDEVAKVWKGEDGTPVAFQSIGDSSNTEHLAGAIDEIPDQARMESGGTPKTSKAQTDAADMPSKTGGIQRMIEGAAIRLRIDIPSYTQKGHYTVTAHPPNSSDYKALAYDASAALDGPVRFNITGKGGKNPKSGEEMAAGILREGKGKFPLATVDGKLTHKYGYGADMELPDGFDRWTPVGFDPHKATFFYDKRTGQEIIAGVDSISIGNTVYVREVTERGERFAGMEGSSLVGLQKRIASFFSGTGTLEGAMGARATSVSATEFMPAIMDAFNKAHGTNYTARSVHDVDPQEIIDAAPDLFHASPVCVNLSKIKRGAKPTEDDMASAVSVARVIDEARPPVVTIENVPAYQNTEMLKKITDSLDAQGYKWQVDILDSADYGGAQTRPRMILRAVREGEIPPMPEKTGPSDWYAAIEDLIDEAPDSPIGPNELKRIRSYIDQGKLDPNEHIITMGASATKDAPYAANAGGPSPTLVSSDHAVPRILLKDGRMKKVTPRMMARLMGMPEGFSLPKPGKGGGYGPAKIVLGNGIHGDITRKFIEPLTQRVPAGTPKPGALGALGKKLGALNQDKLSREYPEVGPPVPTWDPKKKWKDEDGNPQVGKWFDGKNKTPEEVALNEARTAVTADMKENGYEPFFPVEDRYFADPTKYPDIGRTIDVAVPSDINTKRGAATWEKYNKLDTPEARRLLNEAYELAKDKPLARDWYAMGQLEAEFIKEWGPEEGPRRFKEMFADAMAATTGGADPGANLRMAAYGNYLKNQNLPLPPESHQFPHPIGGIYAKGNMAQYEKLMRNPGGGLTADLAKQLPKRHNFSANFIGHRDVPTIDKQMTEGMTGGKHAAPPGPSYGIMERMVVEEAKSAAEHGAEFQGIAWAGFKGSEGKPMIVWVNEMIERTSRITGKTPQEVLTGFVRGDMPMYSVGGGLLTFEAMRQMAAQERANGLHPESP